MTSKIEEKIITTISLVPGIFGISTINFQEKSRKLDENEWTKGIYFENTSKGLVVKVSVIISKDIRAKLVSQEIASSIKSLLNENEMKLDNAIIYIRGVR